MFIGNTSSKAYRLHDLLHDVLRNTITLAVPKGLGLTLIEAHNLFINKNVPQSTEEQQSIWDIPDNSYIRSKLLWHMKKAGRVEDIHSLLFQETKERKNQWYEIKNSVGETGDYLQDINYVLELITQESKNQTANSNKEINGCLVLQLRYILILTSLNSLAGNISINLLAALVKYGLWSTEQTLAYTKRIPQTRQRACALIVIAPYLPEHLRGETAEMALTDAQSISSNYDKAKTLVEISSSLPERMREKVIQQALLVATKVDRANIAGIFRAVAPYLSGIDLQQQAFNEALKVEDDITQVAILANLAPHFPEQLKQKAAEQAFSLFKKRQQQYGGHSIANVLSQLAMSLPEPLLLEALTEAKKISSNQYRDKAVSGLIPRFILLTDYQQAMMLINEIKSEEYLADALRISSPYLPIDILQQQLVIAESIKDAKYKSNALSGLIPRLAVLGKYDEALQKIKKITYETYLTKTLVDLAPSIPINKVEQWQQILNIAISIKDEYCRKKAIIGLSSHLPERLLLQIIPNHNISKKRYISEVFTSIVSRIPESLQKSTLLQALNFEREIGDLYYQVSVLASLASYLSESRLEEVIGMTLNVESEHHKVNIIKILVPYLSQPLLLKLLAYSTSIANNQLQAEILTALFPYLPDLHKLDILNLAFDAAIKIEDIQYKIPAIVKLIPYFPKKLHQRLLKVFQTIKNETHQVRLLVALVPYLSKTLLQQVFVTAKKISDEINKANLLSALATRCSKKVFNQIVNLVKSFCDPKNQTVVLVSLATHLSGKDKEKLVLNVLIVARKIKDEEAQARALTSILPYLPELSRKEVLGQIVELAQEIEDEDRVDILEKIIPILPEYLKERTIELAITSAKAISNESLRAFKLADLMPYISAYLISNDNGWDQLLSDAKSLKDSINQIRLLSAMLSYLSETLKQEVILTILNLIKEVDDEEDLEEITNYIIPLLSFVTKAEYFHLKMDILQILSRFSRRRLLIVVKLLAPMTVDLIGIEIVDEFFRVVVDVNCWWC